MNSFNGDFINDLFTICLKYQSKNTILIRAAYVLGNLTTDFTEVRNHMLRQKNLPQLISITTNVMNLDKENKKFDRADFNRSSKDDYGAITKMVRLVANLLTEE